jgi:hypothetical protein
MTRKTIKFALAAAAAAAPMALLVPPAHAVSCYGDYCSGRDPESSGCSADAYTVAHARIAGTYVNVELRWSPRCKTNWARTGWPGAYNPNNLYAVQAQTGYTQRGVVGNNGTYVWTRMIYSPRLGVSARYDGPPGGGATAFA